MTSDELKKVVEDAVRIGVREALQAEQRKRDDQEREKALNKSVETAVAAALSATEESFC